MNKKAEPKEPTGADYERWLDEQVESFKRRFVPQFLTDEDLKRIQAPQFKTVPIRHGNRGRSDDEAQETLQDQDP